MINTRIDINKNLIVFGILVLFIGIFTSITCYGEAEIITYEEVYSDIVTNLSNHPRILGKAEDFQRINSLKDTDLNMNKWYNNLMVEANLTLAEPVVSYDLTQSQILGYCKESDRRIRNLSMAYWVSGDTKYAEKAWAEIENVLNLPDWRTILLDNSSAGLAVAVGYDWLNGYLSEERKQLIINNLKSKALDMALDIYNNPEMYDTFDNPLGKRLTPYLFGSTNHSLHNDSNYAIMAMAIADVDPNYSAQIISKAINAMESALSRVSPDGGWYESVGYWNMSMIPFTELLSTLNKSVSNMYGLNLLEGINYLGYFPLYTNGTVGKLVMQDDHQFMSNVIPAQVYYLASLYGDGTLAQACIDNLVSDTLMLLWYNPQLQNGIQLPLDRKFRDVDLVSFRSTWKQNETLAGFHVGKAKVSHGFANSGLFMYDALGERWTGSNGRDNYDLPGYWDNEQYGQRWTYYVTRPEANNCLVINPKSDVGQDVYSEPKIDYYVSKPSGAFAWSDLSGAYSNEVNSYKRGIMLYDDRGNFVVQDEVYAKQPSEIYWFMNTSASIQLLNEGKSVLLTQNGKRLWISATSNVNYTFQAMDSVPLSTSPNPENQKNLDGVKKLFVRFENVTELSFRVEMIPLLETQTIPTKDILLVPIEQWSIDDSVYNNKKNEGSEYDIYTSEDAYISGTSSAKNTNYGNSTALYLLNQDNEYDYSYKIPYLKFDLTDFINKNESIAKVNLKLVLKSAKADSINATSQFRIYYVDPNSWSESTLTWNNAPIVRGNLASFSYEVQTEAFKLPYTPYKTIQIDITNFIKNHVNKDNKIISFIILPINDSNFNLIMGSKEDDIIDNRPVLQVISEPVLTPEVISSNPINNQSNVDINSDLKFYFNKDIDINSVSNNVIIKDVVSDSILQANSIIVADNCITITASLEKNKTYSVLLKKEIADIFGRGLLDDYYSYFSTGSRIQVVGMKVVDNLIDTYDSGTDITKISPNKTVRSIYRILNHNSNEYEVTLISAFYEKNRLIDISILQHSIESLKNIDLENQITLPSNIDENSVLKLFLWTNLSNLNPIYKAKILLDREEL